MGCWCHRLQISWYAIVLAPKTSFEQAQCFSQKNRTSTIFMKNLFTMVYSSCWVAHTLPCHYLRILNDVVILPLSIQRNHKHVSKRGNIALGETLVYLESNTATPRFPETCSCSAVLRQGIDDGCFIKALQVIVIQCLLFCLVFMIKFMRLKRR